MSMGIRTSRTPSSVWKWSSAQMSRMRGLLLCAVLLSASAAISVNHIYRLDSGEIIDFDHAVGQWVVITYWASWCGPCREEIRILNTIHREREKRNVIVLGLNFDGTQGEILAAEKARFSAEFPDLLDDPRARWDEPRPNFIPRTLVIDTHGNLHKVLVGSTTRAEILKNISN